jgi:hypothetical protein
MSKRILFAFVVTFAAACAPRTIAPLALSFPVDTATSRVVADGVIQRHIRSPKGPWAIEVLDVDLSRGYCLVAVKGAPGAAGRKRPSALLAELSASRDVIGGVNADFFSLSGFQGVPTGTLVSNERVIVGPSAQPVIAVDRSGRPRLTTLVAGGTIIHHGIVRETASWNRPATAGMAVYDGNWGSALDTASGVIEVIVEGRDPGRVIRVDTTPAGATIPAVGETIVVGRAAKADLKQWARSLRPGDTLRVALSLGPFHPREAVGGRPMLARDSVIAPEVETEGQASFRARNPRTAAGLADNGRRLILAVIDGRQPTYSVGTTLRETAEIMLALGARDAINLDGGGSSALVYRDSASRSFRVANKPSDATGERAVGDALAVVKRGVSGECR